MHWMMKPFRHYASFSGRAPRIEYWSFVLLMVLVFSFVWLATFGLGLFGFDSFWARHQTPLIIIFLLFGAFNLLAILPGLAVTVRRLHDTGRSGWTLLWALVPVAGAVVLICLYASPGTRGENRFGPDAL
jgi:uncharacterized membrane protein YhaH (DUF805 family)